ncbi:MAG TPA: hypothetical protein VHM31_10035 [Polyangia bacterium]|nr:hypothetical protein [Polyangia bacterium]HVY38268.1 hypothetical protein [Polyangia bacterium]
MPEVNVIQIDDVIPRLYQDQIEAEATSPRMAWFFNAETGRALQGTETSYSGFSNTVFHTSDPMPPSPMTALLLPLLYTFCDRAKVPFNRLLRIRLGLFPRTAIEALHHNPHVDFYQPHYNALYYVNDADGDTFIFEQTSDQVSQEESLVYTRERRFSIAQRVSPRKGRMIGFDGKHYHASMHPMHAGHRIAIAFSFL